jgi:O-antigen ligase
MKTISYYKTIQVKPFNLTQWDKFLLLSICIAPAHAGISMLMIIASSIAIFIVTIKNYTFKPSSQSILIAIIFFLYFIYFYFYGAWIEGDFMAPYESMKGNLPILIIAALSMLMSSKNLSSLNGYQVGYWVTRAIFITLFFVIMAYLSQIYLPVLRSELITQIWHGGMGGRLKVYSRNALMFGSMFTAMGFISLIGFQTKPLKEKIFSVVSLGTALITVGFWAESRGALLASAPLFILSIWYIRPKLKHFLLISTFSIGIPLGLYMTTGPVSQKIDQTTQRLINGINTANESAQNEDSSVKQRITMYTLGYNLIKESPLKAYGYQNRFNSILPYMESNNLFYHGHLHNAFLNHWIAGGPAGLLIFLLVVFAPVIIVSFYGSCSRDTKFFAWIIALVMLGIGMTTEVLGHFVHTNFYGLLICAIVLISTTEMRQSKLS